MQFEEEYGSVPWKVGLTFPLCLQLILISLITSAPTSILDCSIARKFFVIDNKYISLQVNRYMYITVLKKIRLFLGWIG